MFKDDFVTKEQMEKYSNFLAERIDEMKKDVMTFKRIFWIVSVIIVTLSMIAFLLIPLLK